jgi:hypothetical protein
MTRRSRIVNLGCRSTKNIEALIDLPQEKKAGIAGNPCTPKINADGAVKFRLYGSLFLVTNRAHKPSPSSGEFGA